MIRHNEQGTPKRRIAIIQIPRPQRARMGSIGQAPPPAIAWTTISDEQPDSSANWISYKLIEQATARQTTPGTLTYTPTADANNPYPNVAPWNSWLSPNCPMPSAPNGATPSGAPSGASSGAPAAAPASGSDFNALFLLFGAITAVAAATYIFQSGKR